MQIARKISIGSINNVSKGFKDVTELRHVARIYGRAVAFDIKTSESMGVSYGFKGEFIGVNQDGEETSAPVCYLMSPADGLLVAALEANNGAAVEFAFDFYVSPKKDAILGYEYKVKSVLEVKKSEPLLSLAAKFDTPGPVKKDAPALLGNDTAKDLDNAGGDTAAAATETATTEEKPTGKKK